MPDRNVRSFSLYASYAQAIAWGMFYGGVETGSIVDAVASDILDSW